MCLFALDENALDQTSFVDFKRCSGSFLVIVGTGMANSTQFSFEDFECVLSSHIIAS
jgi:hypothetical protein